MSKAERLRKYHETHRKMCFGLAYGTKPFCPYCPHAKDCKAMADDGDHPEPLPSREDD